MSVGASPHMGNMGMGRGMIPQNSMNPNPQGATPQPGQQPPGQFGMGGRPPSRTTTPAVITQPSPSLAQRQMNSDLINMEILQIPNANLESLKAEFGLGGKEISALTLTDKVRFLSYDSERI
jgi:collagen type III alpha